MITVTRHHDISCGHRVVGHENKCAFLHGHNYRVHFTCRAKDLDPLGRVIDFSVIKEKLCMWLELNWDHKFLAWDQDTLIKDLAYSLEINGGRDVQSRTLFVGSIVWLSVNPTAENLAGHLLHVVAPRLLAGSGVDVIAIKIEETRKCCAMANY